MTANLAMIVAQGRELSPEQSKLQGQLVERLGATPGVDLMVFPHLYDLTAAGPSVQRLRVISGDLVVLSWLYPRAAFWVLDSYGVSGRMGATSFFPKEESEDSLGKRPQRPAAERTIWCLDLRSADEPGPFLDEIRRILVDSGRAQGLAAAGTPQIVQEAADPRWYPVVDYDRCNDCLECLNFCLFGVFDVDQRQSLFVDQPDACRPGCPACARICPSAAIMFPAHQEPAIAGDGLRGKQRFKLDLSQLFQGMDGAELAAAERARALAEQGHPQRPAAEPGPSVPPAPPRAKDDLDRLVDGLDSLP